MSQEQTSLDVFALYRSSGRSFGREITDNIQPFTNRKSSSSALVMQMVPIKVTETAPLTKRKEWVSNDSNDETSPFSGLTVCSQTNFKVEVDPSAHFADVAELKQAKLAKASAVRVNF
jgi:hypothetical protein